MLGRKKERGEGEGREKNFSLPAPSPAPFDSSHFLLSFRVSTCAFASKTFARPKKTPALQANDKLVATQLNLHNIKIQKHQNFVSQSLTVGTSSKRPPPVRDRDQFLGLTVKDFPLFLTSCKLPLDAFSDLYVRCVH